MFKIEIYYAIIKNYKKFAMIYPKIEKGFKFIFHFFIFSSHLCLPLVQFIRNKKETNDPAAHIDSKLGLTVFLAQFGLELEHD